MSSAGERGGRARPMRRGVAGLVGLALLVGGAGCQSNPPRTSGRPMSGDDVPRSMQEARRLEQLGIEAIDKGQAETIVERKREKYDIALDYLRQAVALYEDEQATNPGTPEKQRACDMEIQRLTDMIHRTHKDRPL
jgi:hypothetical protein